MSLEEQKLIQVIASNHAISSQRLFLALIVGFIVGLTLGYCFIILSNPNYQQYVYHKSVKIDDKLILQQPLIDHVHERENSVIADRLYNEIKILCYVITEPKYHQRRAEHIKSTWGRRCNKLIFISSKYDLELGAISLNLTNGQENNSWKKTILALQYIYDYYIDDYDWFMKAEDTTFVVLENLRLMLIPHDSNTPIYFGSKYSSQDVIYMSSSSGYVLSKEAVKRFNEIAVSSNLEKCEFNSGGYEDFQLAKCLKAIDIIPGDSRDSESKTTFHPLAIQDHMTTIGTNNWFWTYIYYATGIGKDFSSDYPISFSYVSPSFMYTLEFLIYHVQPYGIWSMSENIIMDKYTLDEELRIIEEKEKEKVSRLTKIY